MPKLDFLNGLRVFLRTTNTQSDLHFVDFPLGRNFSENLDLITISTLDGKFLGIFPINAISAILPLAAPESPLEKN